MPTLDTATRQKIVDLLAPLMKSESERRALLALALGHDSPVLRRLELTGAVEPFVSNLIGVLLEHGEVEPGRQALWALLEVVRARVGLDRQARIDRLRSLINPLPIIEDKKAALEQDRVSLTARQDTFIECYRKHAQAKKTAGEGDKVLLQAKMDEVECKINSLQENIDRIDTDIKKCDYGEFPDLNPELLSRYEAELRKEWRDKLHCLNYDEQENRLHKLVWVRKHNAILLFIEHKLKMKADLFIKRVRRCVQGRASEDKYRNLDEHTASFIKREGIITPELFLKWLQDEFKITNPKSDSKEAVQQVIEVLVQYAQDRGVLCLDANFVEVSRNFFRWFLQDFWCLLIDALRKSNPTINKINMVLTTEAALPAGYMQKEWYCKGASFDREKYLQLKLLKWKQQDIECWVDNVVNPSLRTRYLPIREDVTELAKQIHQYSGGGTPLNAHDLILGEILKQVIEQLPGDRHVSNRIHLSR